jgi:diguanylate cyclase (GGDEF)-like protein/PAS domain S-box-containing protein
LLEAGYSVKLGIVSANIRFLRKTGSSPESYSYVDSAYHVFFQENAAAMYVAAIPDGTIEICNDAFVHLLGYDDADQIIGRSLADFFQTSADYEKFALRFRNEEMIRGDLECLQKQDGTLIWILQDIGKFHENGFDQPMILGTVVDITKQKQQEEQFQQHALHDVLTGLPNRILFLDRLRLCFDRAHRKSDYRFAVLFLDLDYFKRVNDTYGHRIGDELLVACARRLHSKIRGADTVARLSGDEFAVLLTEVSDQAEAIRVAARIQDAFKHPFQLDDREIFITVSAGIALSSGLWIPSEQDSSADPAIRSDAMSSLKKPEDLLWEADEVLYRAKSRGRARYEISSDEFARELRYNGL